MGPTLEDPEDGILSEMELLETRLKGLTVEGQTLKSQNDIRTALKKIGACPASASQMLARIHEILKLPLNLTQTPATISTDDGTSNILSFLKLLVEVCPAQTQGAEQAEGVIIQDTFWVTVVEPVCTDILYYLNTHILKPFLAYLSSGKSGNHEVIASSARGTGYEFHQQLGVLQKGVRILLTYLKRITMTLPEPLTAEGKFDVCLTEILHVLCNLMNPEKYGCNSKFDIGLDIQCNIGIAICYSMIYLFRAKKNSIQTFFAQIFCSGSETFLPNSTLPIELEVFSLGALDINRIALGYGILNTWLDKEHDADLYYRIGENVLEIQHGVKESINLGSSRVLEIWIEKLARPSVPSHVLECVSSLFRQLEFFCFMYMPGHIDAVKNCCRNILSAIARIYDDLDEKKFHLPHNIKGEGIRDTWISKLLKTVLEKPEHIKWIALSCVVKNTKKSLKVLDLDPKLPENLLTAHRTFKIAGNDSYVSLMSYHFQTTSEEEWDKIWIQPLFTTQLSQNNESNWPQKRNIISIVLNSEKLRIPHLQVMIIPMLKSIVGRMNSNRSSSIVDNNTSEALNLDEASLLAAEAIKMAYELKITLNPVDLNFASVNTMSTTPEESFRGLVPRSVLHSWLWRENPQIRLAGFALLVETKKTSEIISKYDFESLKIFLKYNLLSQNPAFRQQFMSYFKKIVRRLKDGEYYARKKKDANVLEQYVEFLKWIWTFLTEDEGLFCGANFGRRCQALECLSELTQTFTDFEIFGVTSESNNVKYLRWLSDTYENNKIQALEVLVRMPMKEFEDESFCKNLYTEAVNLCKSVKPPESVTGRYLMTLLMRKSGKSSVQNKFTAWRILEYLYEELQELQRKISTTSLIQVSSESPTYGCVRCIRMILENTDEFKQSEHILKYREYVQNLLQLCFELDDKLFPVLGSAAPEGFLPGLSDSSKENKQVVRSLAAQMLLVCAWRTMKEICLLMADMCSLFVMEGETTTVSAIGKVKTITTADSSNTFILSVEQVSKIGDHLLYLLKNLVHRGVFEQVYVGFKLISNRLWRSSNQQLSRLPEKWLQDAMDQEHISTKSITRRSAGLPFIFQALLSAESDNDAFLNKWMERLFIFDETPEMSLIRIHSMNVLRGLFRDATFSAAMMPFVPYGLKMAFRGLKSPDWTERNSGLMLYGAVMRRSFGPKLNLLNAPTFFRKFPQMYDFLLNEIDICLQRMKPRKIEQMKLDDDSKKLPDSNHCDFTFHLLLLLSSFTVCGQIEDTHFKLAEFIPRIRECGVSDDMEVRKLAAKALIPFLVGPDEKRDLTIIILNEIKSGVKMSQNKLHGLLLQFLSIVKYLPRVCTQTFKEESITTLNEFVAHISLKSVQSSFKSPTIYETVTEILAVLYSLHWVEKSPIYKLVKLVETSFNEKFGGISNRNFLPGLLIADKTIARSIIEISCQELDMNALCENLYNYFKNPSKYGAYIDQFLQLFHEKAEIGLIFNEESTPEVVVVVEAVIDSYLEQAPTQFSKFPASELELYYLRFIHGTSAKCLELYYDEDRGKGEVLVNRLFQLCREQECTTLQLKGLACMVLGKIAFSTTIPVTTENIAELCDMLLHWSGSGMDDDMRLAVANCFPQIPFPNMKDIKPLNQAKIWSSIYLLAQDDDSGLRQILHRKLNAIDSPCCDRKALEVLTRIYFHEFVCQNPTEGLLVILGLIQRENYEVEAKAADDETEDRLFDKSEMNMYFEHTTLARTVKDHLESPDTFPYLMNFKSCLSTVLSQDQINLYFAVSNSASDIDQVLQNPCINDVAVNIGRILEILSAKVPDTKCDINTYDMESSHFTRNTNDGVRICINNFAQDFIKILNQ